MPFRRLAYFLAFSTIITAQSQPPLQEFSLPTPKEFPEAITPGPDGAIWFGEATQIGRITVNGVITEYPAPGFQQSIMGIATGSDGGLWFTDSNNNWIGRLLPPVGGGPPGMSTFPLPSANSGPNSIVRGSDGAMWFTEYYGSRVGRITVTGAITEFALPANAHPYGIAPGPEGALWVAEYGINKIGRMTTGGSLNEYVVPSVSSSLMGLTAGPDGAIWFAEASGKVGRLTTGGVFYEYPVPTPKGQPEQITSGPDGALWFTEPIGDKIGRITTGGSVIEYSPFSTFSGVEAIIVGPDGNLWFTETQANKIGRFILGGQTPPSLTPTSVLLTSSLNPSAAGHSFTLSAAVAPASSTGTVTFYNGTMLLGSSSLLNGTASWSTSLATIGPNAMTATYNGDSTHASSNGFLTQIVNPLPIPVITLTSSANPSVVGQSVKFIATMSSSSATGSITFSDNNTLYGPTPLINGQASIALILTQVGSHAIQAAYNGDTNFSPAVAHLSQVVKDPGTATSTTLTSSANPSALGQTIVLTASVVPTSATGDVIFLDGPMVIGTLLLTGGQARLSITPVGIGVHSLSALYSGDSSFAPSSGTLTQAVTVAKNPASLTLTSSSSSLMLGQTVTLMASVTSTSATGQVTFYDGVSVLGIQPLVSGKADFSTTLLATGSHILYAYYGGDASDLPVSSPPVSVAITSLPGSGFRSAGAYSASTAENFSVGDLNLDGIPDVALVSSQIIVFLGNGDGTFRSGELSPLGEAEGGGHPPVIADFNGDGILDLTIDDTFLVHVFLGNGDGTFQNPISTELSVNVNWIAAADVNRDGRVDLVATGMDGMVVLLGNGDGTFRAPLTYPSGANRIVVADVNGDTIPDVIGLNRGGSYISLMVGNGDGSFQAERRLPVTSPMDSLLAADFNNDGRIDIAVSNGGLVAVLLGDGSGGFLAPIATNLPLGAETFATGDFDGDGVLDLAGITYYDTVTVVLGRGDGTFGSETVYPPNPSSSFAVADLNRDGRADLILFNSRAPNTSFTSLLGDGPGDLATSVTQIGADASIPQFGHPFNLTALALPSFSTGTVTFFDGPTPLGTSPLGTSGISPLIGESAILSITSPLAPGTHPMTAVYNGDSLVQSSTSAVYNLMVYKNPTSLSLTDSSNPVVVGQSITMTATLSTTATGTITFQDGTVPLGTVPLNLQTASFSLSALSVGAHQLVAIYSGDSNDGGSRSSFSEVVTAPPPSGARTTVMLTSSLNPSVLGETIALLAIVSPSGAAGTIAFFDGGRLLDFVTIVNGSASLRTNLISSGVHSLHARYDGSASYQPADSPPLVRNRFCHPRERIPSASRLRERHGSGRRRFQSRWNRRPGDLGNGTDVNVFLGKGDGTFSSASSYPAGTGGNAVVAADLNADGISDLVILSTSDANVYVLLGDGERIFPTFNQIGAGGGAISGGNGSCRLQRRRIPGPGRHEPLRSRFEYSSGKWGWDVSGSS